LAPLLPYARFSSLPPFCFFSSPRLLVSVIPPRPLQPAYRSPLREPLCFLLCDLFSSRLLPESPSPCVSFCPLFGSSPALSGSPLANFPSWAAATSSSAPFPSSVPFGLASASASSCELFPGFCPPCFCFLPLRPSFLPARCVFVFEPLAPDLARCFRIPLSLRSLRIAPHHRLPAGHACFPFLAFLRRAGIPCSPRLLFVALYTLLLLSVSPITVPSLLRSGSLPFCSSLVRRLASSYNTLCPTFRLYFVRRIFRPRPPWFRLSWPSGLGLVFCHSSLPPTLFPLVTSLYSLAPPPSPPHPLGALSARFPPSAPCSGLLRLLLPSPFSLFRALAFALPAWARFLIARPPWAFLPVLLPDFSLSFALRPGPFFNLAGFSSLDSPCSPSRSLPSFLFASPLCPFAALALLHSLFCPLFAPPFVPLPIVRSYLPSCCSPPFSSALWTLAPPGLPLSVLALRLVLPALSHPRVYYLYYSISLFAVVFLLPHVTFQSVLRLTLCRLPSPPLGSVGRFCPSRLATYPSFRPPSALRVAGRLLRVWVCLPSSLSRPRCPSPRSLEYSFFLFLFARSPPIFLLSAPSPAGMPPCFLIFSLASPGRPFALFCSPVCSCLLAPVFLCRPAPTGALPGPLPVLSPSWLHSSPPRASHAA